MGNDFYNFDLEERHSLRRVDSLSTELDDITEVEYRKLRIEKVILVGVWNSGSVKEMEAALQELAALADTAGAKVLAGVYQKRAKADASTYIGKGKVAELKLLVQELKADTIICDGELSPAQLTALERELNIKVIDRTALILDIFAQHAKSREGKAQIELGQLEYMLPRLRGWGQTLSRQAGGRAGANGGVGLRGPGETKLEIDRRRIHSQMAKLRKEIVKIKKNRTVKNNSRLKSAIPKIAILGYTNAGKSSLLNSLAKDDILVEDALFATLDPTSRKMFFSANRTEQAILTDTVGFVRFLPTQLVEAFRSTLDEINYADLLLFVIDGSTSLPVEQYQVVREIVDEILNENNSETPYVIAINKFDLLDEIEILKLKHLFPEGVLISTLTGQGLDELKEKIKEKISVLLSEDLINLKIPVDKGDILAELYSFGSVQKVSTDEKYISLALQTKNKTKLKERFNEYLL